MGDPIHNLNMAFEPTVRYTPITDLQVLSASKEYQTYTWRFQASPRQVKYLIIDTYYDAPHYDHPSLLVHEFDIQVGGWTTLTIEVGTNDVPIPTYSHDPLAGIRNTWHVQIVDVLDLEHVAWYNDHVNEVVFNGRPAVLKMADGDWKLQFLRQETGVYSWIDQYQVEHLSEPSIFPRFLAHVTENGKVRGILLEKIDGEMATRADRDRCKELLVKLHEMGLCHGDVRLPNFLINRADDRMWIIDFENANVFHEELARYDFMRLKLMCGY